MTNYWVLQANPKLSDIGRALNDLSVINWRAPQYTGATPSEKASRSGEAALMPDSRLSRMIT